MATIAIIVDGNDITDDVVISDASFEYLTDGNIGTAHVRVRDLRGGPYVPGYFSVGHEMTLDVDGVRVWGGYVMRVKRTYPFAATENDDPDEEDRFWELTGNDYNILMRRRKLYNKEKPAYQMKIYKADDEPTDKEIISDMTNLYLDIEDDGFEAGAGDDVINLDEVIELGKLYWVEACAEEWQAASPGMDWADGMNSVIDWSGGVYYIGPANSDQSFKGPTFYYHDVNTATGPYEVNDQPASDPGSKGIRDFSHNIDATDMATEALVWGAGKGSQDVVHWRETATSEQTTYGTWQWSDLQQAMYLEECVKHRAKTYIHGSRLSKRGHKVPKESWDITTFQPDFQVGDVVDVESYVHAVQDNVPIRRMRVTFPTHQDAKFDLHLSHYYDTAYATAQWWEAPAPAGPWHEEYISIGDDTGEPLTWGIADGVIRTYNGDYQNSAKLMNEPLAFLGYEGERVAASFTHGNMAWYDSRCCRWVGVGCWACTTVAHVQRWVGFSALTTATDGTLFVDGFEFAREGLGGDVIVSVVADDDLVIDGNEITGGGRYSAFNQHSDARVAPGFNAETIACVGPLRDEVRPAYSHFYSGTWGSYTNAQSLFLPGSVMRTSQSTAGYSNPQNILSPLNWLVLTPNWTPSIGAADQGHAWCGSGACGDNAYVGLPAAAQGPRQEGIGGSGGSGALPAHFFDMTYGENQDFWWINPFHETDPTLDVDEFGDGRYYSPAPDADGYYYTRYPYLAGTLSVSINGRSLVLGQEYWETNPTTGQFRININGFPDGMQVRYRINGSATSQNPGYGGYYPPGGDGGGHYQDVPNGIYYRPRFRSQLGWDEWSSYMCTPASCCQFIDRSTHGAKQPTPPQVRVAMSSIGVWRGTNGASINDAAAVIRGPYRQYVLNSGIVGIQTFINTLAQGRGAMLTGNSTALVKYNLHARSESTGTPFLGFHSLYVNEVRSDGKFFVYDPAFRVNSRYNITPGWYPARAIQDYAAYRTGSTQRIWAIYTRKTPRL